MRKKEIIVIVTVITITIFLIVLPVIISNNESKENNKVVEITKEESKFINLKITGEINYLPKGAISYDEVTNEFDLEVFRGITYADLDKMINIYYTIYSKPFENRYEKITENTTIVVESTYVKEIVIEYNTDDRIDINLASDRELKTLYGIGEKRVEKIREYMNQYGKIESFEILKSIIGVSDEVISHIKAEAFIE